MKTTFDQLKSVSLLKSHGCYNPYIFNGFAVDRIYFYDNKNNEVIFSVNWWGSNNYHKSLIFNFEIKKANKKDLSKKTAFFVNGEHCKYEKRIDIYIPTCLVDVTFLGEKKHTENENEITYMSDYKIIAYCTETSWKLNDNKELVYFELPLEDRELIYSTNWRQGKNPIGELKQKMSDIAKTVNVNLSTYDFDKLFNVFDIKIK